MMQKKGDAQYATQLKKKHQQQQQQRGHSTAIVT